MNRGFFLLLLLVGVLTQVQGWGNRQRAVVPEPPAPVQSPEPLPQPEVWTPIEVTGLVRLVGSHPFYQIVVSGQGAEWMVPNEERGLLMDLQHRTVTLRGEELIMQSPPSDNPYQIRLTLRHLRNITILEVHPPGP
ncbi:MAG: hypothetical protein FWH12_01130 [Treponema sp.]|nr:hypothetical protein [Treponema sp.]